MNVVKAPDLQNAMRALGRAARAAADKLALADTNAKTNALRDMAAAIRGNEKRILEANAADMVDAKAKGRNAAMLDRLMLEPKRVAAMAVGLEEIAALPDP